VADHQCDVSGGQSVQKLHGDEGFAMLVIDFVDRANVGMIQGRGGLRLSFKAS